MVSEENDPGDDVVPTRTWTTRFRERIPALPLVNKYVGAAVLIQFVGYAALSALIPHSDYASLVEPLQRVPVLLLVPFAITAIPALVLALAFGGILSVVGAQPTNVLVVISIYLVGVASVWGYRKIKSNGRV